MIFLFLTLMAVITVVVLTKSRLIGQKVCVKTLITLDIY